MNRQQKMAWFMIVCILGALVLSLIAFGILYIRRGMPDAWIGFALMGLAGLGGLAPAICKESEEEKRIGPDERDRLIWLKASRAGFAASYLYVGVISFVLWLILGREGTIAVQYLPGLYFIGSMLAGFFVQSIMILHGYGWRSAHE